MKEPFFKRLKHSWSIFRGREPTDFKDYGLGYAIRPDRVRLSPGSERTIVSSIINRIGIDVASINIRHVQLDKEGRYQEDRKSTLNERLSISANLDQTGRAFIQDVAMSLCDEGCVAIVPTETDVDPRDISTVNYLTFRVGEIIQWYPSHILARVYNQDTGEKEEVYLDKTKVAIVENPLYSVMNEPNSTLNRLKAKLSLLDAIDNQSGSGKLDLLFQLPYSIKSEMRKEQAEERRKDIEKQLTGSKYGIAYIDATEHVTQLNRPVENNLLKQIEYLTSMLYSQLGFDQSIFDGTAKEETMLNYYNRTIEPIISAICESMERTFITKTARSQGQAIRFFRDPFKLVPVNQLADIADKFTRNEILSSNEIRSIIGRKPSKDPKADELVNKNINQPDDTTQAKGENQNESKM